MLTSVNSENIINKYWNLIKEAPNNVKLKLISLLSDSVSYDLSDLTENNKVSLLKEITGSWDGSESDDFIINKIRENRTSRPPIDL